MIISKFLQKVIGTCCFDKFDNCKTGWEGRMDDCCSLARRIVHSEYSLKKEGGIQCKHKNKK